MIKAGQKIKNHFIAEGDQLKIDFENYSSDAAKALIQIKLDKAVPAVTINKSQ